MKKILTKTTKEGTFLVATFAISKTNHEYFSITGEEWESENKYETREDRYLISGGAMADRIAKEWPELEKFCDLHLSDSDGKPMYHDKNGFYFWQIYAGIAEHHTYGEGDKEKYFNVLREHLRISKEETEKLCSELNNVATVKPEGIKEIRESIKNLWSDICVYTDSIKRLEKTDYDTTLLKKRLKEAEYTRKSEQEEIKKLVTVGQEYFTKYTEKLLPVWKKEAEEFKKWLSE